VQGARVRSQTLGAVVARHDHLIISTSASGPRTVIHIIEPLRAQYILVFGGVGQGTLAMTRHGGGQRECRPLDGLERRGSVGPSSPCHCWLSALLSPISTSSAPFLHSETNPDLQNTEKQPSLTKAITPRCRTRPPGEKAHFEIEIINMRLPR